MARMSKEKLERRLRREARSVIRENEKTLKRHGHRIPSSISDKLAAHLEDLRAAREAGDGEAMRRELRELDQLSEQHLGDVRRSTAGEYAEAIVIALAIAFVLRTFVVEAFKIPSSSMIPTLQIGDHIFVNKILYGLRIPGTDTKLFDFREPHRGEVVVFKSPCEPDVDFIKRVVAVAGDTIEVRCGIVYVNGERIEQVLDDPTHEYWDRIENGPWRVEDASLYAETIDGKTYRTIHNPHRPETDAERAGKGDASYPELRGQLDFPRSNPASFSCQGPDHRTPEIIAEATGAVVEVSIPERDEYDGVCGPRMRYVVPEGYVFAMGDNREHSSDSRAWGPVPLEYVKGKALFIWMSMKAPEEDGWFEWKRSGKIVY